MSDQMDQKELRRRLGCGVDDLMPKESATSESLIARIAALTAENERLRAEKVSDWRRFLALTKDEQISDLESRWKHAEARTRALEEALWRARLALEHWGPPDPHHNAGAGHVCDTECEEMYHYAKLMTDLRAALARPTPTLVNAEARVAALEEALGRIVNTYGVGLGTELLSEARAAIARPTPTPEVEHLHDGDDVVNELLCRPEPPTPGEGS